MFAAACVARSKERLLLQQPLHHPLLLRRMQVLHMLCMVGLPGVHALKETSGLATEFSKSHVTRRLAIIHVDAGPGAIQSALMGASPGDELVLNNGTYSLSSTITIDKDITIRAATEGQAILDGGDSVRVLSITSGVVSLAGLSITRGSAEVSRAVPQT